MNDMARYLPGMCKAVPPLAQDFVEFARSQNCLEDHLIYNMLFNTKLPLVPLTVVPGRKQQFEWMSGHGIKESRPNEKGLRGPHRQYEAAIIGKCLTAVDVSSRRLLAGRIGDLVRKFLEQAGLSEYPDIYLTNLLKTTQLLKQWKAGWVSQQATFTKMELLMTRPKYVLALGKDVCKFLLSRSDKIADIEGRWFDVVWDIRQNDDEELTEENQYRFKVLPCMHPAALEYESTEGDVQRIQDSFSILGRVLLGQSQATSNRKNIEYPVVRSMSQLRQVFKTVSDAKLKIVAVDAEWQGSHPQNDGAFIRCVQFAWESAEVGEVAFGLHLSDTEGEPDFEGSGGNRDYAARREAFSFILDQFRNYELRVGGYFFPADLEWLVYYGLDLTPWYEAAETVEACKTKGGFALELAVAAVDELARNDLDSVRWRFTDYPFYSHELKDYVKREKGEAKKATTRKTVDESDLEHFEIVSDGYGWIPDEIIYPYAVADAVVTLRGIFALMPLLDKDRFGMDCWLPYFNALGSSTVAAEIMQVGLPFDTHRCLELAIPYSEKYFEMIVEFQTLVDWPSWNPDSSQQVVEAMYGTRYSTKRDPQGRRISVRPLGAKTLAIVPVLNNDSKSPQLWSKIVEDGQEHLNTPGTNGKTIGVLSNDPDGIKVRRMNPDTQQFEEVTVKELPGLMKIRDMRTLGQLRKTFIGKYVPQKYVHLTKAKSEEYTNGLVPHVCQDGYIRAFISQVKETGRWSASRPNLHAMPKRREAWYARIMGDRYPGPIRSAFAAPPGYLLIEADYKTAELFMLAVASGDMNLWRDCQFSLLDDTHPDYVDIHANVAVSGLQLKCAPTKKGLGSIGKGYLRDVAKCYAEGELIGTESGWLPVERLVKIFLQGGNATPIQPGRFYLQSDMYKTPLLAVHKAGQKECFSIKSALGYELIVSGDHETFVLRAGDIVKVKTCEIEDNDYLVLIPEMVEDADRVLFLNSQMKAVCSEHLSRLSKLEVAKTLGIVAGVNMFSALFQQENIASVDLMRRPSPGAPESFVAELRKWMDSVSYSKCGNHLVMAGEGCKQIFSVSQKANWYGIPEEVFLWSFEARKAFTEGLLSYIFLGTTRRPVVALVVTDAEESLFLRRLQQLILSLGFITKRSKYQLSAVGQNCLTWWQDIFNGRESREVGSRDWGGRIPGVVRQMLRLLGRPADSTVYHSKSDAYYYLNLLEADQFLQRHADVVAYTGRVRDMLDCGYYFDRIALVSSVGVQDCYDVQTSKERNRAVVAGGVLSSNSIVFGWAYGRQPPAIVIQAKEEGIIIQLTDAEAVVSSLYRLYPLAAEYLENASGRVANGFLCTPMGRWRRTPDSQDRKTLSAYEREFKNAPIQGGVADVVNIAGRNLRQVRKESGVQFSIAMQIHDAFLFLVPYAHVHKMVSYVIPEAMSKRVPIVPRRLDGSLRTDVEPKFMSVDMTPYFRWGVKVKEDELEFAGIDPTIFKEE